MKTTALKSVYSEDLHQDTEMHFHDPFSRKDLLCQLCNVQCCLQTALSCQPLQGAVACPRWSCPFWRPTSTTDWCQVTEACASYPCSGNSKGSPQLQSFPMEPDEAAGGSVSQLPMLPTPISFPSLLQVLIPGALNKYPQAKLQLRVSFRGNPICDSYECYYIKQHFPLLIGIQKLQEKTFVSLQIIFGELGDMYNSHTPFYIKHCQNHMTVIGNTTEAVGARIPREESQMHRPSKNRSQRAQKKYTSWKWGYILTSKILFLV